MTGWPIAALWKRPAGDGFDLSTDPLAVHVFCVEPSGRAVDAEGLSSFDEVAATYCAMGTEIGRYAVEIHGPEAEWLAAAAEFGSEMAFMSESSILEAASVIRSSESFGTLVSGLGAISTAKP